MFLAALHWSIYCSCNYTVIYLSIWLMPDFLSELWTLHRQEPSCSVFCYIWVPTNMCLFMLHLFFRSSFKCQFSKLWASSHLKKSLVYGTSFHWEETDGHTSLFFHLLAVWFWASYSTHLCLNFLICKMRATSPFTTPPTLLYLLSQLLIWLRLQVYLHSR